MKPRHALFSILFILALLLAACAATVTPTLSLTAAPSASTSPAPSISPSPALADLFVTANGGFETSPCVHDYSELVPVTLEVCVHNGGAGDAGAFVLVIGDVEIPFGGLAAGGEECVSQDDVPFVADGITVDADDQVAETNEDNNIGGFITPTPPPTCTPSALPDLWVGAFPGQATYNGLCIGSYADLTPVAPAQICVYNYGQGDAGPFVVQVGDTIIPFEGLAAGEQLCVSAQEVAFDPVIVDLDNQVAESDETNNQSFFPIPTQPPFCTPTPTP